MSVITHPRRYSGVSLVEVEHATATGLSFNVRKRDGESVLTVFLGWSEVERLMREGQHRAAIRLR